MTYCPDCGDLPKLVHVPDSVFEHGFDQMGYTCEQCSIVAVGIDEQDARENWEVLAQARTELNREEW